MAYKTSLVLASPYKLDQLYMFFFLKDIYSSLTSRKEYTDFLTQWEYGCVVLFYLESIDAAQRLINSFYINTSFLLSLNILEFV